MINKAKRRVWSIWVGLGVAMAGSGAMAAEQFSMATPWGGGPLLNMMAKGFAEKVEFLTDGEIKLEVFPGGTLGSALKVTETVRNRVAEASHNWSGYDWGIDKTGVLFGGFAGSPETVKMIHWMYKGGGLELWREWRMEKFGVVAMPCGTIPREIFMHSRKPVKSLADYQGMKVRTSGAWAEIASRLGASTVILPGAEVYPALERGVVDGIEWGTPSMNKSHGFAKVAKYVIVPGLHQPSAFQECQFNPAVWDGLSDRQKQLIAMAAKDMTLDVWMQIGNDDADAFQEYMASGNEVIDVDDDFKLAAAKATAEWADEIAAKEGGWFAKVLASQREFEQRWSQAHRYR